MAPACSCFVLALALLLAAPSALTKDVLLSADERDALLTAAAVWFPDRESLIPTRDVYNVMPNPLNISVGETINCTFIEPDPQAPEGGVTPKFQCNVTYGNSSWSLKIKYDQRYNSLRSWGKGNNEVYASPIVERLLWALGFGADVTVPVAVRCFGCPIEPWTYIRKTCGLDPTDYVSGWVDIGLVLSGGWKQKADEILFDAGLAYFDWDVFQPADRLFLNGTPPQPGWGWPEMYQNQTRNSTQWIYRDALTTIAAFVSHVDNYFGNQGFNCIFNDSQETRPATAVLPLELGQSVASDAIDKDKPRCPGTPFLFIHDVGCTLGYGWDVLHGDLWPDAMDLKQWLELEMWSDLATCTLQIHGIPGASWMSTWQVTEEGRAMAARLIGALTPGQVADLFNVSRVAMFKGDTAEAWIAGWQYKLQRDLLNVTCGEPRRW